VAASESLDYLNPFMAATIVMTDGKRYPLWLKTSAAAQRAANLKEGATGTSSLPFLAEVTVEIQLAYLPIIKATLTPPYRDAINFLNSRLIEWGQSQFEVQFGYIVQQPADPADPQRATGRAILSEKYVGILLKPEVQLGPDVVITLNAQGVGGFAAARQEGNFTVKTTRQRICKVLMGRYGVNIDDSEVLKLASSQAEVVATWNKELIDFAQQGDSFWTAVVKVIRGAGFHTYLLGSTLKVLPASFVFGSKPTKLFRFFDFSKGRLGPVDGGATGVNRVLPIFSASSPTSAIYLPGSAQGFWVQDVSSFDRSEKRRLIGDQQVAPPRTSEGAAAIVNANTLPAVDPSTGEGAEMYPGDPEDPELVQWVKSEYAAQTTQMGVQLTLETVGDPTLLPGNVIAVRGLGRRLDSNYSVFKVTHTVGGSGYTMSLECVSNVAKALENAVEAVGPTAPQPTLDESSPTSGTRTIDPSGI
jgi:hypothetical protein